MASACESSSLTSPRFAASSQPCATAPGVIRPSSWTGRSSPWQTAPTRRRPGREVRRASRRQRGRSRSAWKRAASAARGGGLSPAEHRVWRDVSRRRALNTLIAVIIGAITVYLGYNHYARRIDRDVIEADPKKVTPARMYMDGVDFVPTNRNVLYGYHFKSIAAAGPIVGAITAANIWGWLPSIVWLFLGVMFIGWASDYSAIMVSVRNDGNSISAIAHRLIAPRTRTILLVFIFFYLLLVAGAFGYIVAGILDGQPQVPLAIVALMVMGLLGGQMLYRWRMDLLAVTAITVGVTLLVILLGPVGASSQTVTGPNGQPQTQVTQGPVGALVDAVNGGFNAITGNQPVISYYDPTLAPPTAGPQPAAVVANVNFKPSFILDR